MFRRKEDDTAHDLLGNSGQENATAQATKAHDSGQESHDTTKSPAMAMNVMQPSVTAPQQQTHVAPSFVRPTTPNATTEAARPTAPTAPMYRPASAAPTSGGRAPEYRPQVPTAHQSFSAPTAANSAASSFAASHHADKGQAKASGKRVLTVGNDILLKGEIATCDRLVIEGAVDATLNEVHTVEIAENGSFKGFAEIEDAEISGLFEGELVVRNRLVVYASGRVRGKITYGEIEIERGGELTGEIRTMSQISSTSKPKTTQSTLKKATETAMEAA
jgi:cytoskeletal protein CcmA (bactofilin family)